MKTPALIEREKRKVAQFKLEARKKKEAALAERRAARKALRRAQRRLRALTGKKIKRKKGAEPPAAPAAEKKA